MSTRAPTMLTSAILAHPQRELIAAHSVNHQSDGVILEPHYDLSDEPPDGALARHRRRAGTVSDALDISAEREQAFAFELGQCGSALAANLASSSSSARTTSKRAFQRCSSSAATRRALALVLPRIYHIFLYTFNEIRENVPAVKNASIRQPKVSGVGLFVFWKSTKHCGWG